MFFPFTFYFESQYRKIQYYSCWNVMLNDYTNMGESQRCFIWTLIQLETCDVIVKKRISGLLCNPECFCGLFVWHCWYITTASPLWNMSPVSERIISSFISNISEWRICSWHIATSRLRCPRFDHKLVVLSVELHILFLWVSSAFSGFLQPPKNARRWIGDSKLPLCTNVFGALWCSGILFRVYFHLTHRVPGIDSTSAASLTQILKMTWRIHESILLALGMKFLFAR